MTQRRRQFSREFKVQAVKMVTEQGLSVSEVARDLDVNPNLIRKWKQKLIDEGVEAFPGNGRLSAEQEEIRKLREENRQLRMERDILKKATAFFAKENDRG